MTGNLETRSQADPDLRHKKKLALDFKYKEFPWKFKENHIQYAIWLLECIVELSNSGTF